LNGILELQGFLSLDFFSGSVCWESISLGWDVRFQIIRLTVLSGMLIFGKIASAEAAYYLAVNSSNKISEISQDKLENIFSGRMIFWESGGRIRPSLIDEESPSGKAFLAQVVKMDSKQYVDFWRRKLFSGRGLPPRSFKSEKDLIHYVSENEGAIAVLSSRPGAVESAIRIIEVIH
jgi:hypothetical protein